MIDKSFTMVNKTWLVRIVTTKQLQIHLDKHPHSDGEDARNLLGLCDPRVNRIFINKDLHTSTEEMEETYWHEFQHAFHYALGEEEHDETIIQREGQIIHQYHKTKKGA